MNRLLQAILLLLSGVAFAQNVPPGARPGGPLTPPAIPAAPTLPGSASTTRLQFPNTDVKEVLNFYALATKKRLVVDNQVQGTVNIVVAGEVPIEEAVRIIEINLLLNGFTLVPVEGSNIVKVVGSGKNPRSAAIPIISDELLIPEGEQVVTYLAKLRYADPAELQQMLTTYVSPAPGGYTNITALPKSQALLITENSATIRGVLRILHTIDVPPAEVVSEFIPLQRADASDILEKLTAIFDKQPNTVSPTAAARAGAGQPGVPSGAPPMPGVTGESSAPGTLELRGGALSEDSIIVGKIKLTADVRTNRIHVVTRPVNLAFVRKLIHEFDESATFGEPVSRPLRFVSVGDVLDVVVKAISEPGAKDDGAGASGAAPRTPGSTASAGNRGASGFNSGSSAGTSGATGSEFNVSEGLATEAVDTTPEARVIGTTKIIADKNANAIIIIGGADVKAKVFRLLDHLDQRIPQVMLHTVIGELNLNEREQFGVDYILRSSGLGISPLVVNTPNSQTATTVGNDGTGTGIATGTNNNTTTTGNTATTGTTVTPGRNATDLVSLATGRPVLNLNNLLNQDTVRAVAAGGASGLSGFVTAGNSMTAIVTALEDTNRFRVVSRPSVFTRNNKKAIIASGQEIAVPVNIQSSVNSVNPGNAGLVTNSSVQFKRVALQLEVVPLINSDREVSLDILQKVDEVSGSTRIDNNDIPNIATRYVKTSVTVPDEGTLVLGGLIKQSQNRTRSGIPILSNIPVLGYLFSSTTKEKIRTELVILIRPVVSWAPPESIQIRERAQEFMNMDPDIEATLFPPGVRKAASRELPAVTPIPVKRAQPADAKRKPASPTPTKRAAAGVR